jgi:hypothetical protein
LIGRRYRAPSGEGEMLCVPAWSRIPHQLELNRQQLTTTSINIDGTSLNEFRQQSRIELLRLAKDFLESHHEPIPNSSAGPWIVTGHQPEWFHPGVWVKNFATATLAEKAQGVGFNLIVDNDTLKSTAFRIPMIDQEPKKVVLKSIPFDSYPGEIPYEHYSFRDHQLIESLPDRLKPIVERWGFESQIDSIWPRFQEKLARQPNVGQAISSIRREVEREHGIHNWELPISAMCSSAAFQRFATFLLNDLPNFHRCYNQAVQEYRQQHGLKSANHPVPDLATDVDRLEAPFWGFKPGQSRRGRVMSDGRGRRSLSDDATATDFELRPRALSLTIFARIGFADWFIHGIGGGKYDEVTDRIIELWLGIKPPDFQVLSATIRLPLEKFPGNAGVLRQLHRQAREMYWHPEQFLDGISPDAEILEAIEWRQAHREEPMHRADRRAWFRMHQQLTAKIRSQLQPKIDELSRAEPRIEIEAQANAKLMRRDIPWPLFDGALPHRLKQMVQSSLADVSFHAH